MDGRDDEHIHLVSSGRTQRLARRRKREVFCYCAVATVVSVVLLIGLGLAIAYGIPYESTDDNYSSGTYKHAAVAADAPQCSKVGVDILKKDGSAVDAAIASLLCVGVVNFHSTGIGGGGFMVYYNATSKTATTFDYRETAPGRANSSLYKPFGPNENASLYGGLAIAVPGELRGLELAHRKFGKLSWDALFQPAAQIADEGFAISSNLAKAIQEKKNIIINGSFKGLQDLLAPGGVWLEEGDVVSRKKYAQTLRDIGASGNASYFYEGSFMEEMVKELQNAGAIIEEEDFLNYSAIQRDPVESEFGGLRVIGVPPPSSGAVLALILNILHGQSKPHDIHMAHETIVSLIDKYYILYFRI
jgi:gamma-glutamyltranspeptidase/glutathione hydrolase/leukotriene-C4 hydrolase